MGSTADRLERPDFNDPPVKEVAISARLDGPALDLESIVELSRSESASYPVSTLAPPVQLLPELPTESPMPVFEMAAMSALPVRLVRASDDGTKQVQFQQGLVGANWICSADAAYPRFPAVRDEFVRIMQAYAAATGSPGDVRPAVLDVTYVNRESSPEALADPAGFFRQPSGPLQGNFALEGFELNSSEVIFDDEIGFVGRVRKTAGVVTNNETGENAIQLTISARIGGQVLTDFDEAMEFAHLVVVSGFVATTNPDWHIKWGKTG